MRLKCGQGSGCGTYWMLTKRCALFYSNEEYFICRVFFSPFLAVLIKMSITFRDLFSSRTQSRLGIEGCEAMASSKIRWEGNRVKVSQVPGIFWNGKCMKLSINITLC